MLGYKLTLAQVPRCTKRYQESCVEKTDGIDCAAAVAFCNTAMSELFAGQCMRSGVLLPTDLTCEPET